MASLAAGLLVLPRPAQAGAYTGPTYTMGDYSNPSNRPNNPPLPRIQDNYVSNQAWGGGTGASYGVDPNTHQSFSGAADCGAAPLTASIPWIHTRSGQTDQNDPPAPAIVTETTQSGWSSDGAGATGDYSNPYKCPTTPSSTGYGVSETGMHYSTQAGANPLMVTGNLTASASGTGSGSGVHAVSVSVSYTVSVSAVTIDLGGTLTDGNGNLILDSSGNQQALTGQRITATLQGIPGGFTVTKYTWSGVGSAFKNYDPTQPSNQLTQLGSTELSGPASGSSAVAGLAFYDGKQESLSVTCAVTVMAPDGTTLSLTATAPKVDVMKPTASWAAYTSGPFVNNSGGYGATEYWNPATITVPSPFSGGTGCFAQLITPSRQATRSFPPGTPMVYAATYSAKIPDGNGGWMLPSVGLDTAFPYPFGTVASSGAQVSSNYTWDVSSQGKSGDMPTAPYSPPAVSGDMGGTNWYTATMKDAFTTWVMYKPAGGVWVALQNLSWSTNITVSDVSGPWSASSGSTVTTPSSGTDINVPPTWTTVNSASQVQMRP